MTDTDTPIYRRTLNVTDVPVGTKVVLARNSRTIDRRLETEVTKVTKTYLETASGHRFNVSLGNRYGDAVGRIGDERKSIHNPYPKPYRDHDLYLVGDPYLESIITRARLDKEREERARQYSDALNAARFNPNHEKVEAAMAALQTWLTNNPKES